MATIVLDLEEDLFIQMRTINCAGESDNASILIGTYHSYKIFHACD